MRFSFLDSLRAPVSKSIHKRFTNRKNRSRSRSQATRLHGFRLGLELLEDRLALNATNFLVVTSPSDIDAVGTFTLLAMPSTKPTRTEPLAPPTPLPSIPA